MTSLSPDLTQQTSGCDEKPFNPRRVLLFSGHRIDAANRAAPRFPLDKVAIAEAALAELLAELAADKEDLALTQGANGADLIFAEQCQLRGVPLQLLLPLPEADFIEQSVVSSPGNWLQRYQTVTTKLTFPIQVLSQAMASEYSNPFEACNHWLLTTAMAYGAEKAHFICLWNGGGGDSPGGTAHMVGLMRANGGQVYWLDTRKLW